MDPERAAMLSQEVERRRQEELRKRFVEGKETIKAQRSPKVFHAEGVELGPQALSASGAQEKSPSGGGLSARERAEHAWKGVTKEEGEGGEIK